jgi:hypothetical protein
MKTLEFLGRHRLHGAVRADRHERGCFHHAMRELEAAAAGGSGAA